MKHQSLHQTALLDVEHSIKVCLTFSEEDWNYTLIVFFAA